MKKICLNKDHIFLADHVVLGRGIFPASGYFEIVLEALAEQESSRMNEFPQRIKDAVWLSPLSAGQDEKEVDILFESGENGHAYRVQTQENGELKTHAAGTVSREKLPDRRKVKNLNRRTLAKNLSQPEDSQAIYKVFDEIGIVYNNLFKSLEEFRWGEKEALAKINISVERQEYRLHPGIVDAAIQCVLLTVFKHQGQPQAFVPFSMKEMTVWKPLTMPCYVHAVRHGVSEDKSFFCFDLTLTDEQGTCLIDMKELCVKSFSASEKGSEKKGAVSSVPVPREQWAVAATFTAEPIEEPLAFWAKECKWDAEVAFAPYNQVFQELLSPQSLLGKNKSGANIVLLRLEDLQAYKEEEIVEISEERKEECLGGKDRLTLPNGMEVAQLNPYETRYLYEEIFVEKTYLKQGIELNDGDVVIDIGANIGMFALFVAEQCKGARTFSFEPSPITFDVLKRNLELNSPNATVCNCGVSDTDREETFTFYPNASVFSGFHPDAEEDGDAIRKAIENAVTEDKRVEEGEAVEAYLDMMVKERLVKQTYRCPLKTISTLLKEYDLEQIDLLKIDAEKCEVDILKGIRDEDWKRVRQIVIEVHDKEGGIFREVMGVLKKQGFELGVVEEKGLEESGLYNIYGTRSGADGKKKTPVRETEQGIERNLKELVALLKRGGDKASVPLLLGICPPSPGALASLSDAFVRRMADWMARELEEQPAVSVIHFSDFESDYDWGVYYDAYRDELGRIPYTPRFFAAMATLLVRRLHALRRNPYKVIALDCDNTLWEGVCGEQGAEGVRIGPGFQALQQFMVEQKKQGMLLCLASKNSEEDVKRVFDRREEMVLKWDDLAGWKINWESKSGNLQALAGELNVGLDSFIFLDDNAVECAEVGANAPAVLPLQLPAETDKIPAFLKHVWASM